MTATALAVRTAAAGASVPAFLSKSDTGFAGRRR